MTASATSWPIPASTPFPTAASPWCGLLARPRARAADLRGDRGRRRDPGHSACRRARPGRAGASHHRRHRGAGGHGRRVPLRPEQSATLVRIVQLVGTDGDGSVPERTGGPVPVKPADIDFWLASTPSTPATQASRVEVLAFAGRYDDARAELAALRPTTPEELFEAASLRQYIDWLETGSHRLLAARRGGRTPPAGSSRAAWATSMLRSPRRGSVRCPRPGLVDDPADRPTRAGPRGRVDSPLRDTWLKFGGIAFAVGLVVSVGVLLLRPASCGILPGGPRWPCGPDARHAFRRSSVVERAAVNRLVVGSNPTAGAILSLGCTVCAPICPVHVVMVRLYVSPHECD